MGKTKLKGRDLVGIGFTEGRAIGIALNVMAAHYKKTDRKAKLDMLRQVVKKPEEFVGHEVFDMIAQELIGPPVEKPVEIELKPEVDHFAVYGRANIERGAFEQMETAMRLPVTHSGALMADAHQGYGLPIGGVLATTGAVIPYGVGVDIGCRMCLTVYDLPTEYLKKQHRTLKETLMECSRFGRQEFESPIDHEVLERKAFQEIKVVRELKDRAWRQIGTSGSGNHFVEFGIVEITDPNNEFGVPPGEYVGLLTHSGSRGLGANIARHYTQLAMEKCKLPKAAKHLAWLDLDTEEGQEYWAAMTLAGDYASACHHQIHDRVQAALGVTHIAMVENHHNFAWKETAADGTEVVVHRKGATPAGTGVLGIIPGSMTAPGYIVRGRGNADAIFSASHGAGRKMSRKKAKESVTMSEMKKVLKGHGVTLLGGGLDESPHAYKDIKTVMQHQNDLVDVVGTFLPKIVRMDK